MDNENRTFDDAPIIDKEVSVPKEVIKRNGDIVPFDENKIVTAVTKALTNVEQDDILQTAIEVTNQVVVVLSEEDVEIPSVDDIHITVENTLMDMKLYDSAREYITYRDHHKPDIFRKRTAIKPYEYPELIEYVDAIRHSYWIHNEFNYNPDIQDIKINLSEKEVTCVTRAMLAISQIESAVKKFWGRIDDKLPKPEVAKVGASFSESEVRHEDAYSNLIEILGLNDEFQKILDVPAIQKRVKYLEKVNANNNSIESKDFFESIILFSMFIENVSLFSQFYIIMSFNKHKNILKGMSNAIEATSKEETIHAMFGFDLVNIIKKENPDWWTDELVTYIKKITVEAFEAEKEVVEWIYEEGDVETAPKKTVIEYIKKRLNDSLKEIGVEPVFDLDYNIISETVWFDDDINITKEYDFFNKRSTAYNKRSKSVTADDLF